MEGFNPNAYACGWEGETVIIIICVLLELILDCFLCGLNTGYRIRGGRQTQLRVKMSMHVLHCV